jgi:uncharacterized membrane protein YheB (UPF0754 family)
MGCASYELNDDNKNGESVNMIVNIILMAAIGGLIGYSTNVIAVKMLFRPLHPVKIPILGFTLQGLVPKRKDELSKKIGKTVAEELVSSEDIIDKVIEGMDKYELLRMAKDRIMAVAEHNMPPMVPSMFKGAILKYIGDAIDNNGEDMLTEMTEKVVHKATTSIDIEKMVSEKIDEFDVSRLEEIIFSISKTELRHIEVLGGVLGVAIGIVQGFISLLI